jgi:uncharacterized membrane protein YhaH (DUF805 family)
MPPSAPQYQPSSASGPVGLSQPLRGASISDAASRFFKKYTVFTGRASRSEFWYWSLIYAIVGVVISLTMIASTGLYSALIGTWSVATIVPSIALGVRRLHDIGKSGLWILIGLVPFVGAIILLVFCVSPPNAAGDAYNVP